MIIRRRTKPTLLATLLMTKQSCLVRVNSYKYLGVWLTPTLNWST